MSKNEATPTLSVEVDGVYLVIRCPMTPPRPSTSGKTLVVASTNGNIPTTVMVQGQPVILGLNAYIRKA